MRGKNEPQVENMCANIQHLSYLSSHFQSCFSLRPRSELVFRFGSFQTQPFSTFGPFKVLLVTLAVFLHLIASLSAYSSQLASPQTGKEQQKALAAASRLQSWAIRRRDA